MGRFLESVNTFVWGAPALLMILSVGVYLTIRLKAVQITLLPQAIRTFFSAEEGSSSRRALYTALAATVGTGNLVGVAGAISLGGPGSVFWMWVCGILGMVTKYAEAVLAVRYRVKTARGYQGGPMYVMVQGLGSRWKPLAAAYCLFGVVAAFGVGCGTQVNAAVAGIGDLLRSFGGELGKSGEGALGLILAVVLGRQLLGGAKRIGEATEKLVPFAAAAYILLCLGVLLVKAREIPDAFAQILRGAFSPRSVTGGVLGSAFQSLRIGCSRGVFTNEAGMGTAAMAHAGAEVSHPVRQGMMGIVEVFLDTILICTLTALVILVSGVSIPYGTDAGGYLTTQAFSVVYGPMASVFLAVALMLFAAATVLGWGLYGARCVQFLFGDGAWKSFALAQTIAIAVSAVMDTAFVWQLAETVNGLMVIPNLITLAALGGEAAALTQEYRSRNHRGFGRAKNLPFPHHRFD